MFPSSTHYLQIILRYFHFLKTLKLPIPLNKWPYFLLHRECKRHQRKYSHFPDTEHTNLYISASILFMLQSQVSPVCSLKPFRLAVFWSSSYFIHLSWAIIGSQLQVDDLSIYTLSLEFSTLSTHIPTAYLSPTSCLKYSWNSTYLYILNFPVDSKYLFFPF